MSDHNPYEPSVSMSRHDVPAPTLDLDPSTGADHTKPIHQADVEGDQVPDGNIREVLHWVGDSKDRARAAETAEQQTDEPRQTLLNRLKKVLEA